MSSKNSNRINVPEARKAMSNMKHEVASELGITLSEGYNGNIANKADSAIKSPSGVIAFADCTHWNCNNYAWTAYAGCASNSWTNAENVANQKASNMRHAQIGSNLSFADGHAEFVNTKRIMSETAMFKP